MPADCTSGTITEEPTPALADLIAVFEEAEAAHDAAAGAADTVILGRNLTADEEAALKAASDAGYEAWERLAAYRTDDLVDLANWTRHLAFHARRFDLEHLAIDAIRREVVRQAGVYSGLIDGETLPPKAIEALRATPAALIDWLGAHGCFVTSAGFAFPDGCTEAVITVLSGLTPDQGEAALDAARICEAWFDASKTAGGVVHHSPDDELDVLIGYPMPPPAKPPAELSDDLKPAARRMLHNRLLIRRMEMAERGRLKAAGLPVEGDLSEEFAEFISPPRAEVGMSVGP